MSPLVKCMLRTQSHISLNNKERLSLFKEARTSFSFFQTNKHILFLDTVRVIISRQNLARVLKLIKYPS